MRDFRNSLKGFQNWDLYISKMSNYIKSIQPHSNIRLTAGTIIFKSLITNGSETNYPIGQAWVFKAQGIT